MTRDDLANLSFADLRARLKARRDELNAATDLSFDDVFRYLIDLPLDTHTPDSIEALIEVTESVLRRPAHRSTSRRCARCASLKRDREKRTLVPRAARAGNGPDRPWQIC